jgi:hypothetical protein
MTETPARKIAQRAACDRLPLIRLSPLVTDRVSDADASALRKIMQLASGHLQASRSVLSMQSYAKIA